MTPQQQLIEHDPDNGRYGDCQRTCIAAILDMKAEDVPHFCDGADTSGAWLDALNTWLDVRGLRYARFGYEAGACTLDQVLEWTTKCNPGVPMILNGRSALGSNHVVIVQDGAIVCDPSGNGIVGPNSDGMYVVEVVAVGPDWGRHRSITAGLGALVGDALRDLDQLATRNMHRGSDVTITFDVAGEPFSMTVRHDLQDAGPDDFPTREHDQHSPEYARCVAIADRVVPAYRAEGSSYSCTGHIAHKWQAAFEGAAAAIGVDFVLSSSNFSQAVTEADLSH